MMSTTETEHICGLRREDFQTTINGKKTDLYFLKNNRGNVVAITNYGGALVAIMVPDRNGVKANVIQGHDNVQDVINSPEPYLSTLIGRYGNRICKGKFQLHGKEYQLPINNGPNSLHGGKKGFNAKVWDARQMNEHSLVLEYTSPYGEEGFSGEVKTTVVYSFTDDNELVIDYMATTNKKTIINLTSHGFFSLSGIANPTASIPKAVGKDIDADDEQIRNGAGYDHCFVLNKKEEGELSFAAKIVEPVSGRTMEVYTTEPGVQVYTDNWADGYKGQNGATFPRRSAICFEAQHFPDSPNHPYFPSVVLKPEGKYTQKTIYKFGVEQ